MSLVPEVGMATVKVTAAMQSQILELHRQGRSDRAIAKIVGENCRRVSRIIKLGFGVLPAGQVPDWAKAIDWGKSLA